MTLYQPHTKDWFKRRVGEVVKKEFTKFTPQAKVLEPVPLVVKIESEGQARALFEYHRDFKVNINQVKK